MPRHCPAHKEETGTIVSMQIRHFTAQTEDSPFRHRPASRHRPLFRFYTAVFRHVLDTALDEFAGSDNRRLDIRNALGYHFASVNVRLYIARVAWSYGAILFYVQRVPPTGQRRRARASTKVCRIIDSGDNCTVVLESRDAALISWARGPAFSSRDEAELNCSYRQVRIVQY